MERCLLHQIPGNRMEKERKRLLKWYLRGAEKLGGLIQLFEDDPEIRIVGRIRAGVGVRLRMRPAGHQ